jgi:hypothetical protein
MSTHETENSLNSALRQFELTEANLIKLERLWAQIESAIPSGVVFGESPEVENLCRAYALILEHVPYIEGKKPTSVPMSLDEIAQVRLDANEIGDIDCHISTEQAITAPGRELREYRFNFDRARRQLVHDAIENTINQIDSNLRILKQSDDFNSQPGEPIVSTEWATLKENVAVLATLLGKDVPQKSRWSDMVRHLRFGKANDLRDIIGFDWPSVKAALQLLTLHENEPLNVEVHDLSNLIRAKPTGPVATKLAWSNLEDDDFERLVFSLVSDESGYENAEWLMHTNAPDRGRDISVYRILSDPLSGYQRQRVIIQCKHWLTKSIALSDVSTLRDQMQLWEPPRVDVHIIATSGRFTADAVAFIENHNQSDHALRIEMWPESHLERLLARRPALIAIHRLR